MTEPYIGGLLSEAVGVGGVKSARPVYGRIAATFATQLGTLAGYRGLRLTTKSFELSRAAQDGVGSGMRSDWYVPVALGPFGAQLWLGVWLYAEEGSAAAVLTLSTQTLAGAVIDGGYTVSSANGHLPTSGVVVIVGSNTAGAMADNDRFWSTPWRLDGGGPRLLDVAGHEGTTVLVRMQTTATRIYGVTALQAYRERVG